MSTLNFSFKLFSLIFFLVLLNLIMMVVFINHLSLTRSVLFDNKEVINAKLKRDWHDYKAIAAALNRTGPGELGAAVLFEEYKKKLYNEYGYDAVLSDQISINRSVPDVRPEDCKNFTYLAQLPKAAIIIIFYNERLSVLLRTIQSIINRSPDELIQEIILVDDCSTYSELHELLTDYLRIHLPRERSKVRLIRLPQRGGLMVARMTGARAASKKSEVLIFMDSHFEVNYNWLPPLLEPISLNAKTCTCPALDTIEFKDFKYSYNDLFRGYFDWDFVYQFRSLHSHEYKTPAKNYYEYVLMGAAIAINAEFFWDLGGFDEGMVLWGGEQYELSFKIWMCGGEIITVACSRMAHLYRDPDTKGNTNLYGDYNFMDRNIRRLIDVWMDDEHREYIFNRMPKVKEADPGNLTDRIAIRDRLKCKSFSWMLDNIMLDLKDEYPPIMPLELANGLLKSSLNPTLCVALLEKGNVILEPCPAEDVIEGNKHWNYTWRGEIHINWICLEYNIEKSHVSSFSCHQNGGNQKWYYDREMQWIIQEKHNKCMVASIEDRLVKMDKCDPRNLSMKFTFSYMNQMEMNKWENKLHWSNNTSKK